MPSTPRPLAFYVNPREPNLENEVAWLADHGISHLGTNSMPADDLPNIRRMADLLEKYNMRLVSAHGEFSLLASDGDDSQLRPLLLSMLERVKPWHAENVVVHFRSIQQPLGQPWKDGIWWDENAYIQQVGLEAIDQRLTETLSWLAEEALKSGINITVENVAIHFSFAYRVDEIAAMVRAIHAPNLGICLDSGHAHMSGVDVPTAIRCAGDKLLTTHFHDTFSGLAPRTFLKDSDLHLVPGLGTIDWPAVLRALDEVGYNEPIVFEGPRIPGEPDKFKAWELTLTMWAAFEKLAALPVT